MNKAIGLVAWALVLFVASSDARGQVTNREGKGYVTVNGSLQAQSRRFTAIATPVIYGEDAPITVPLEIAGGALIDVAAGVRVWRNLAVGVGFSRFANSETPTVSAQIPNPLSYDSPRPASAGAGELSHNETAVHLQFLWMMPVSGKAEVAAIAGPSFYRIVQDRVSGISVAEGPPPFATVNIASVETATESRRTTGFTAGVDAIYLITRWVGAGVFARFSAASVDLPTGSGGSATVDAGGLQLGGGLRARF